MTKMKTRLFAAVSAFVATFAAASDGGLDPLLDVKKAIARGESNISVREGRYFVEPNDVNGKCYLELKGLENTVIDFGGSDIIAKCDRACDGCYSFRRTAWHDPKRDDRSAA